MTAVRAVQWRAGDVPVGDALSAAADELERVRTMGLRIEGAICAIAVQSSIDGSVVAELQQLDAMLQQVAAMRDFLGQLARLVVDHPSIDITTALARITLADVRARLAGDNAETDEGWEML